MRVLQNHIIFSLLPILSRFIMEQNVQQPNYAIELQYNPEMISFCRQLLGVFNWMSIPVNI